MAMMQKNQVQTAVALSTDVDSMPIAASGFWAKENVLIDCVVPKISGVGCAPRKAPKSDQQPNCRLTEAKKQADVGENIRWDIILQEAAKLPCQVKPNKVESDDGMSTSAGATTDSDADTDSNSGCERGVRSKLGKDTESGLKNDRVAAQPETSRVYSVFTMLRVWDMCSRAPSSEPVAANAKPFAPAPGLAAPPGLPAPPAVLAPGSAPRKQKSKKTSPVEPQTTGDKARKELASKKEKLGKPLKDEPVAKAAPWRRNTTVDDLPMTSKPKGVASSPPWRRDKDSAMRGQAMSIAPPPGL